MQLIAVKSWRGKVQGAGTVRILGVIHKDFTYQEWLFFDLDRFHTIGLSARSYIQSLRGASDGSIFRLRRFRDGYFLTSTVGGRAMPNNSSAPAARNTSYPPMPV